MMKRFQTKNYNQQITLLWRGIGGAVSLLMMLAFGLTAWPTQGAAVTSNNLNTANKEVSAAPAASHSIVIGFDQDAAGINIPHGTRIKEQYAALGVHFNRNRNDAFYTARRLMGYSDYKTTTTLNLLCTAQGASGTTPD